MSTFFVLLLILSAVGVWYFIKKKPDKKMRNYSIIALLVCFVLVGVTSPDSGKSETTEKEVASKDTASKKESEQNKDSSKQDLPLELDSLDIETDKDGNAVITGKTEPGSEVKIGYGILNDPILADKQGKFSISYSLSESKNEIIEITSSLDGKSSTKKTKITASTEYLAVLNAEEDKKNAEQDKLKKEADDKIAEQNRLKKEADDKIAAESRAKEEQKEAQKKAQEAAANVPTEYKSALKSAETYAKVMYMSRMGIYDQLTSEYGGQFSPEAGQYAIDNIQVDWNSNALKTAKNYQDTMAMSPEAIRDQLTSEYGSRFTPEEADFAVTNLNN
ncbi:Ltp family lipoprotein [Carnobacterium maltaromaticum]|uniref:Ltp family lipoprotein n=1 Tax=Carnobacterium maltaromaticum TaxID=2751 RepID=UPI001EE21C08|nr:Ltp family lipoprotein [Carnobacterium maltaromaticum]